LSDKFNVAYLTKGRPPIPPERLMPATLIQAFHSVRWEPQLMDQTNHNLLLRWLIGLSVGEPVRASSTFGKNRDRSLAGDFAAAFLDAVAERGRGKAIAVGGTLVRDGPPIQVWVSMKSFGRKAEDDPSLSEGRNGERDFHKKRANETHASTTDLDARLYLRGRGKEAKLAFIWPLLMENRKGLVVDADMTKIMGTAEPEAALAMLGELSGEGRIMAGDDRKYDTAGFVVGAREINVTPHVIPNINEHRGSNIDARTTRHLGYAASQLIRKPIEEADDWITTVAGMEQAPLRVLPHMRWMFKSRSAAYNLARLPGLRPTG
jgi:Transposase domain (DUF772)